MKGNILVIKGRSLYNVLRIAADDMIQAFQDKGYEVTVTDGLIMEDLERFSEEFKKKHVLIFSFQAIWFDYYLEDGVTSIYTLLKDTPVFGHIMDHPIYHCTRLEAKHGDNMYVGCIDKSHVDYIDKYYPDVRNVVFLPHGGFTPKRVVPYGQRSIDVFFPGSYRNMSEVQREIDEMQEVYKNMAKLLISKMTADPMLTLQDALASYFDQIKFEYSSKEFELVMNYMHVVDQFIHEASRNNCIQVLIKNGVHITVCGSGWENVDPELAPFINVIGSNGLDFTEVLEVMADSKFVLNHVPTLQNGMHERIFTSMICGAVCLTHDFPIMHEEFSDGENVILYTDSDIPLLADRIKELLNSPEQAEQIARRGQEIALSRHTWAKNAEAILKIVGLE